MKIQFVSCFVIFSLIHFTLSQKSLQKCKEYTELPFGKIDVHKQAIPLYNLTGKESTNPGEFPHMAILGYGPAEDRDWLCGGSLISDNYIVSLASCGNRIHKGNVSSVRLGVYNYSAPNEENRQEFEIAEIILHPNFKSNLVYNDIMLLKLDRKVTFTKYVRPACLYTLNELPRDAELAATGWGLIEQFGNPSDVLLKVYLDTFTKEECDKTYSNVPNKRLPNGIDGEQMICLGGRNRVRSTCAGDSGGPLQLLNQEKTMYEILGLTSFGKICGIENQPDVFTKITPYLSWIENIVWT